MTSIAPRSASRAISRRSSRRGIMLLIVTLVLTALTLSGAALLVLMKAEREATSTRGFSSLVKGVDRSAVVFLIAAIESTQEEREKFGGLYDNPGYFCAAPLLTIDEGGEETSRFTVVSPKITDSKVEGIRYGLVDESTRLNLEAALAWEQERPGTGRAALMKIPGMTEIAADSILDWIDPDENTRSNGAEARYYSDKKLPYSPRNATPVFLEELLLARGVTRTQIYGTDENFTYNADKLETEESQQALGGSLLGSSDWLGDVNGMGALGLDVGKSDVAEVAPWKELLTVFSAEKDVDPKGEARVDLNGTDLQFLYQELQPRVGENLAKFIVLYRQYGPQQTDANASQGSASQRRNGRRSGYAFGGNGADSTANANNVAADGTPLTPGTLSSVQLNYNASATTSLKTPLDIVGARVVVENVVYDSPIPDNMSRTNADALFQLLDYCSTNETTTIVGRVNINAAPRVVLAATPGLNEGLVSGILERRPDPAKTLPSDYRHASWLYTKGLVNLATMRELYNKTTGRGDVYRGQVIGFLDGSDEIARAEVVVDGTTIPPRQVFYRDLSSFGKGFNASVILGGLTTGASNLEYGGTDAEWRATEIPDLQTEQRASGYNFAGGPSNASDPFASIDSQLNNAGGIVAASANASATATGAVDANATLSDPNASASNGAEELASDSASTSSNGSESRRDRLLNALRSARDQRQARYNVGNATNDSSAPTVTPEETPTAEPIEDANGNNGAGFGGNQGGGRGGRG